jgi:hypothetical protein
MAALLSGGAQLGTKACVECCYASRVVESMTCAVSACMWLLVYSCRLAVVQARLFPGLGAGHWKARVSQVFCPDVLLGWLCVGCIEGSSPCLLGSLEGMPSYVRAPWLLESAPREPLMFFC